MKNNKCEYFILDDWGVCKYQIEWDKDTCENNCLKLSESNQLLNLNSEKIDKAIKNYRNKNN